MQPDVPRMEHDFTGVVAPDVTENEKIGPKNRADDIKNDEYDRKNRECKIKKDKILGQTLENGL